MKNNHLTPNYKYQPLSLLRTLLYTLLFSLGAQATVDLNKASYIHEWKDFLSEKEYSLNLVRQYDSRRMYDGLFGFGWCSQFEKKLIISEKEIKLKICELEWSLTPNLSSSPVSVLSWKKVGLAYHVTSKNGDRLVFDSVGRLTEWSNKDKYQLILTYNGFGRLATVSNRDGERLEFDYSEHSPYVRRVTKNGRARTLYVYRNDQLVETSDENGLKVKYQYNSLSNLTLIKFSSGEQQSITYDDSLDRVKMVVTPDQCRYEFSYITTSAKSGVQTKVSKSCNRRPASEAKLASRKTVVAVIDTGADISHPRLQKYFWTNPGETGFDKNGISKSANKKDDDGNGWADDVHGWNFADNNGDLQDTDGHGTHIAGIIAGQSDERIRKDQKAPADLQLMILKYYDVSKKSEDLILNTAAAIRYAVDMGAKVINYSSGGATASEAEQSAIRYAREKGVIFIAASGNNGALADRYAYYPASYDLDNIVSVAANDEFDRIIASSNFGARSVDIAAKGKDVLSTLPGGLYGTMTGTSQATAQVSRVAALLISEESHPLTPTEVALQLFLSGKKNSMLFKKTKYQRNLDRNRALQMKNNQYDLSGHFQPTIYSLNPLEVLPQPIRDGLPFWD